MTERPTPGEMVELSRLAREGDVAARNRIVEGNIGLAAFFADLFRSKWLDADDRFSAAQYGLLKAASRFDAGRGMTFARYARYLIQHEIQIIARRSCPTVPLAAAATIPGDCPEGICPDEHELLVGAIGLLPERWREVMSRRLAGETHLKIGAAMGLSRARVQEFEQRATSRLRVLMGSPVATQEDARELTRSRPRTMWSSNGSMGRI